MSSVQREQRDEETKIVPSAVRGKFRACLRCHLVKTERQVTFIPKAKSVPRRWVRKLSILQRVRMGAR